MPDPFRDLDAPKKPRQEAAWLTPEEFTRLLEAAGRPHRTLPGLAERDRLVLLALVATGLRRSELLALDWADLDLDSARPSLLVRCGKGGKPRRQPLSPALAHELLSLRAAGSPRADSPVFCGLEGKRLQPAILGLIVRRAAERAGLEKRVTAHPRHHLAAPADRRRAPCCGLPRPRRPLHGQPLRPRRRAGDARGGGRDRRQPRPRNRLGDARRPC